MNDPKAPSNPSTAAPTAVNTTERNLSPPATTCRRFCGGHRNSHHRAGSAPGPRHFPCAPLYGARLLWGTTLPVCMARVKNSALQAGGSCNRGSATGANSFVLTTNPHPGARCLGGGGLSRCGETETAKGERPG